jgi:hypothetical protein
MLLCVIVVDIGLRKDSLLWFKLHDVGLGDEIILASRVGLRNG